MARERRVQHPSNLDWRHWIARWDAMQSNCLVARQERFELLVRLLRDIFGSPAHVLDLGCGSGSVMVAVLEAFPKAEVWGVDLDPALLLLAQARLEPYSSRAHLLAADLRELRWIEQLPGTVEAALSATALHWLSADHLAALYRTLARILRPGGLFLNADHVGSPCATLQAAWEAHRDVERARLCDATADDWPGFWRAYGAVLGPEIMAERQHLLGEWKGVEEGMPLAWHLDQLREAGFTAVDCFWRRDGDAIYGGIR